METAMRRGSVVLVVVLAAGLSACSTVSEMDMNPGSLVSGGRDIAKEQESLRRFQVVQVCPEVQVRQGTEAVRSFVRGQEEQATGLRYQGSITRYARECNAMADGGTALKVGVAGRLIAGAAGFEGSATLPLRVVLLKNGAEVVYSQVHPVSASVPAGQGSAAWTQVVDGITVPFEEVPARYVIYVGFDEAGQPG